MPCAVCGTGDTKSQWREGYNKVLAGLCLLFLGKSLWTFGIFSTGRNGFYSRWASWTSPEFMLKIWLRMESFTPGTLRLELLPPPRRGGEGRGRDCTLSSVTWAVIQSHEHNFRDPSKLRRASRVVRAQMCPEGDVCVLTDQERAQSNLWDPPRLAPCLSPSGCS